MGQTSGPVQPVLQLVVLCFFADNLLSCDQRTHIHNIGVLVSVYTVDEVVAVAVTAATGPVAVVVAEAVAVTSKMVVDYTTTVAVRLAAVPWKLGGN